MNVIYDDASSHEGRLSIYNAMMEAYKAGNKDEFWRLNELLPAVVNDLMDHEMRYKIGRVIRLADNQGDQDVRFRLNEIRPMPTFILETIKRQEGLEGLFRYGYNLAEAEVEHGKQWLER